MIDLSANRVAASLQYGQSPRGQLLLTSVREEHDPLWLWATRSLFRPRWDPRRGAAAGSPNTMADMQESKICAWEVAVKLALSAANRNISGTQPMPLINTGGMTGPSGGLMFALAFTDALNEGDLTGGRKVAGTGTINDDAQVGDIEYVAYKAKGAAAAGADVFFVPTGNYWQARRAAPGRVEVVPVATLVDAVRWLCGRGATSAVCATLVTSRTA